MTSEERCLYCNLTWQEAYPGRYPRPCKYRKSYWLGKNKEIEFIVSEHHFECEWKEEK